MSRIVFLDIGYDLDIAGVVPDAPLGSAYTTTLTAVGGVAPYAFTLSAGAVATGHTFTDNGDGTATLAGTATDPGVETFTVTVEDATRLTVPRTCSYRVAALPLSLSGSIADGIEGEAISATLTISGGVSPYTIVTASLSGASFAVSGNDVDVTGTYPAASGSPYAAGVTIEDADGTQASWSGTVATDEAPELWTPASLTSTPEVWLDDTSTFTASGGLCSNITNLGSLGSSYNQGTGSRQPTVNASDIGGLQCLDFDGTGDKMGVALNLMNNVGYGYLFAVFRKRAIDGSNTARTVLRVNTGSADNIRAAIMCGRGISGGANIIAMVTRRTDGGTDTFVNGPTISSTSDAYMVLARFRWTDNVQELWVNGESYATGTAAGAGNTTNSAPTSVFLSAVAQTNDGANGDAVIGGALKSGHALTDTEIDKLFGWAAHKWGLTANLPALHPYKSSAPTV